MAGFLAGMLGAGAIGLGSRIGGGLLMDEPELPEFKPIDVQQEQLRAIEGNIEAFPQIETLGAQTQEFMLSQMREGMEELFPGIGDAIGKSIEQLESGLAGELPEDVTNLIAQRATERGFATGTAGSQLAQFGELRDIGQTSLARIENSLNSALRWAQSAIQATPVFDPGSFFITPQFQAQFAQAERNAELGLGTQQAMISAAYAPGTIIGQSLIRTGSDISNMIAAVLGTKAAAAATPPTTTAGGAPTTPGTTAIV